MHIPRGLPIHVPRQWMKIQLEVEGDNPRTIDIKALVIPQVDDTIYLEGNAKKFKVLDIAHLFGEGRHDTPYQQITVVAQELDFTEEDNKSEEQKG